MKLADKVLFLVCVPLLLQFAFVGTLDWMLKRAEEEALRETRSRATLACITRISSLLHEAYTVSLTLNHSPSDMVVARFDTLTNQLPEECSRLLEISQTSEGKETARKIRSIVLLGSDQIIELKRRLMDPHRPIASSIHDIKKDLEKYYGALAPLLKQVSDQEAGSAYKGPNEAQLRLLVQQTLGVGIALNVVLVLMLAVAFNRETIQRLKILMENTVRLGKGQPLNPCLVPYDEIGELDHVFHDVADQLKQASELKQEVVSMVSHDIRAPLMSIKASLDLLKSGAHGELSTAALNDVDTATSSVNRLMRMVHNLLDLERLQSGKFDLNLSRYPVKAILEKAVDELQALAAASQVSIDISASDDFTIQVDEERMIQVLVNLLSNAIKFSPPGGTITMSCKIAAVEWLEIRIADQGPGIPESTRLQLFSGQISTDKQGFGLGLPICKAIVEGHGGEIGVENGAGGCEFWFRVKYAGIASGIKTAVAQPSTL